MKTPLRELNLTSRLIDKLPRRLKNRVVLAAVKDGFIVVWLTDINGIFNVDPKVFPHSDQFPTEADIARLCVECR